jgi:deazaflavin-dependent oxidoreductase (nitroreductase family)
MIDPCALEKQFFRLLNRVLEPRIRAGWGSPRLVPGGFVVLETKGRRTGRPSRTPLAAIRFQNHVVVSTFRGQRSQWVKNVSSNPDVRYWLHGRPKQAKATVLSPGLRMESLKDLPPALRWLARSLVPYTYAGWAFAVLAPESQPGVRSAA